MQTLGQKCVVLMYTNLKGKNCRTIQILGQNVYDSTTLGKKCVGLYKHKDKNVQKVTNIRTKMCRTIQNLGHKICVGLYKHSDKKCVRLCTVYTYMHTEVQMPSYSRSHESVPVYCSTYL
jgi:hypothetical protein